VDGFGGGDEFGVVVVDEGFFLRVEGSDVCVYPALVLAMLLYREGKGELDL
jgi:hypothetical protein